MSRASHFRPVLLLSVCVALMLSAVFVQLPRLNAIHPSGLAALGMFLVGIVVVSVLLCRRGMHAEARSAALASRHHTIAFVTVTLGVGASLWMSEIVSRKVDTITDNRIQVLGNDVTRVLHEWAYRPIYGMNGARGVYAASQHVSHEEFNDYVASRDLPDEFPGIKLMGYVMPTPASDLDGFVARAHDEGCSWFEADAHEGSSTHWIVRHACSKDGRDSLVGSDLARFPSAIDALDRSVVSGEPVLVCLSQDPGASTLLGLEEPMLWLVPVYRNGEPRGSAAERSRAVDGVLFSTFSLRPIARYMEEALAGNAQARVSVA